MSGQIFISYRREESRWSARSLHDRLCRDFDPTQIFMDIDAIALGEDFVEAIETTVAKCDVLIAVIGNNWLTSKDDHGDRRLDNPEDFVRMEIGAALKRKIRVIPVLVDGALMPRSTDLPEDLRPLVRRNALSITDISFDGDCQRLVAAMRLVLEKAAVEERERLDAQSREREEKERLEAEEREKTRLEVERREREERQRQEAESAAAKRRENERLVNEQHQRDSSEVQLLDAERRKRLEILVKARKERERLESELKSKGNIGQPSQEQGPPQAETPPIVQKKGLLKQKPSARAVLVVSALVLIVGLIWFAGSQLSDNAIGDKTKVGRHEDTPDIRADVTRSGRVTIHRGNFCDLSKGIELPAGAAGDKDISWDGIDLSAESTTGISYIGSWESTTKSSVEQEPYIDGKIRRGYDNLGRGNDYTSMYLDKGDVYSYRLRGKNYGKFRVDDVYEKTLTISYVNFFP